MWFKGEEEILKKSISLKNIFEMNQLAISQPGRMSPLFEAPQRIWINLKKKISHSLNI